MRLLNLYLTNTVVTGVMRTTQMALPPRQPFET